jgi:flagellar motor switch protein FliN/FliY
MSEGLEAGVDAGAVEVPTGMVVEIDRVAGAPIDLLVNGRRIAVGEVVVIDEEFGIRITEIAPPDELAR